LHAADLKHPAVFAHGLHEGPRLVDGLSEGLFAVDILAGPGGKNADEGMPMIGGGDHDGVDFGAGEQVAEVGERLTDTGRGAASILGVMLLDGALGMLAALGVDVADGGDDDVRAFEAIPEQVTSLGAITDKAKIDPGGRRRVGSENAAGQEVGSGEREGGCAEKAAAIRMSVHGRSGGR
jgi:hypothetical protein